MASRCISTIYDQNSQDMSPRHSRGLISREFWSYIIDIHQEAMVYIIYAKVNKNIIAQNSPTKPFSQQSRCSMVLESCRSYLDGVLNCLNCLQLGFK